MAKRVVLLLKDADWISMAGAHKRFIRHPGEVSICPVNSHIEKQITGDTRHIYFITHGSPGKLTSGQDIKSAGKVIGESLQQSARLVLDICFSAANGDNNTASIGQQILTAIQQGIPKNKKKDIQVLLSAAEGPVISGWTGKRGFVNPNATELAKVIQGYLKEKIHHQNIREALLLVMAWGVRFDSQPPKETQALAEVVSNKTKDFFTDFERYVRKSNDLKDSELRSFLMWLRSEHRDFSKSLDMTDTLTSDELLVKLRGEMAKLLDASTKKYSVFDNELTKNDAIKWKDVHLK